MRVDGYLAWARLGVGAFLIFLAVVLLVSPPVGGVPVPELISPALAIAGALTVLGRRYDIAVRILWAITAATFALTLVHYNVACTTLYSGDNLVIPPEDVWLACAPAWPLFSAPALSGALVLLVLAVRAGFAHDDPAYVDALSHEAAPKPTLAASAPRMTRKRRPRRD